MYRSFHWADFAIFAGFGGTGALSLVALRFLPLFGGLASFSLAAASFSSIFSNSFAIRERLVKMIHLRRFKTKLSLNSRIYRELLDFMYINFIFIHFIVSNDINGISLITLSSNKQVILDSKEAVTFSIFAR